ncbi:DNA polymerase III, delta prime subunit, putative [Oceanicola granulosus HTCC2516]|uniref:DNA polymerase III, delta prime subunit, putative n=1 Tax=Oceanicola granulosus (strain ATCC BAA-861 / DSM 15982 / KCTC 12143 / HTCC2516) TaxID=314256 RepID=Q2CCB8_OCEGH|nr:DNA polymerase III subunit delta' [Oceanicola granulosus]EAR50315.1 DNA polymerase III, delta prime subunit, putative [Oceanicola granulosus HTCC2516]
MPVSADLPAPDQIEGAPHPRETPLLYGQARAEAGFLDAWESGRLHSGWLLTGPRGVGKATLAWKIAAFLLAEPADDGLFGAPPRPDRLGLAPDHPDMRLILAGAHPRLHLVRRGPNDKGDKLSADIRADVVRGMKRFFQLSAADGGRRAVIVDAADEMNVSAANSLLKELEEPPERTTLLLVSHQPSRLLPTIRSRCRELRLAPLGPDDMAAALAQAGVEVAETEALAALAAGSVGEAIRLVRQDGLALYGDLVKLLSGAPRIDRPAAIKLAESCTGRANDRRFEMTLDLLDRLLARIARAGIVGAPDVQGAPGEARLLTRLSPDAGAARRWAELSQTLIERSRHGRAVNLDPASLILDMVFKIEETARATAAASEAQA